LTGYSIACPPSGGIILPEGVVNLLDNITLKILNETSRNIDETQGSLQYISGNTLYYSYVTQILSNARAYSNNATHYLGLGLDIIANSYAFRSLVYSTYSLWLTRILSGRISVDDVVREVNDTVNSASNLFGRVDPFKLSYFSLEAYIDNLASYYDSLILFYTALNSTSLTSQLSTLAYAYVEASLLPDWMNLVSIVSGGPPVSKSVVGRQALTLYSLASTTVPYAETLASETGLSVDSLTLAGDYYSAAQQALNLNDTLALIGLSIYASAYSSLALHQMFSQGQAITADLVKTIGEEAYCLLSRTNFSSIMAQIYYEYGLEALNASSLNEALAAFSMSILYSQAVQQTGVSALGEITPFTQTPAPTTLPSTITTSIPQPSPGTYTSTTPGIPVVTALIISLIALISLVIGILLLWRGSRSPR
jgi:hypothetical protein